VSTAEGTPPDDALLPSPAGADAGAGQPAIPPWLAGTDDDHRLTTLLPQEQRRWVLAVCEASHAEGGALTPMEVVGAAVERLMREHADPHEAAGALLPS
jgi:hypothetical protein